MAGLSSIPPKIGQKSKWADLCRIRWDIVEYEVPALWGINKGVQNRLCLKEGSWKGFLGSLEAILESFWGVLGALLGSLWGSLGGSWAVFGDPWSALGRPLGLPEGLFE